MELMGSIMRIFLAGAGRLRTGMGLRFWLPCLLLGIWAQPEYAKFRVLMVFLFLVLGVKCWLFSKMNVWERRDESHICERGGLGGGGEWGL